MISQVTANPKSTTSNQYGFYAIPKTIKPKAKYRQTQYEEDQYSKTQEPLLVPIEDQEHDPVERDFFVDQAPYPEFMPKQPGIQQQTQVEDQELFDYNLEVEPLLEILVGQAVLKARNQLQQQHQQVQSRNKLREYQKKRQAQLMVTQRMEAHNRRRNEENQRRLLQHDVHGKQKKLVLKKLHAVNQSKKALLNLKSSVLDELEAEGFLRYNIFVRFRSQFLPWLYQQIDNQLVNKASMTSAGEQILTENQDELTKKHRMNMDKEASRRKQILDQREEERLAEQDRKRKKAIRKERLALNKSRKEKEDKIYEAVGKAEKTEKITKNEISDGVVKGRSVSYISGGALGYLSEILAVIAEDAGITVPEEKLEGLLIKILKEFQSPVDLNLPMELKEVIEGHETEGRTNPISSNQKLDNMVDELVENQESIASVYQNFLIHSARNLKQIIKLLLKVYLTQPLPAIEKMKTEQVPPEQQQSESQTLIQSDEPKHQLTESEKIRLSVKPNLRINFQQVPEQLRPSEIIRIRYPRKQTSEENSEEEYIEIFDGQGWNRLVERYPQFQLVETPLSFNFSGFQSSIIHDEISNNLYGNYLVGLLNAIGVQVDKARMQELIKKLSDDHAETLREKYGGRETPIYDAEVDI